MGTLYGSVIGATLFLLAESYLQNLMGVISRATEGLPILPHLFHPDRWLLWLGLLFILSVYFFPTGVVGRLRRARSVSSAPARQRLGMGWPQRAKPRETSCAVASRSATDTERASRTFPCAIST
jgi:hypothetical protein